jgi:beta-lactamase superfamily II metal-dependent hydrolase
MSYYGIEIDMIAVGDADSILVTKWDGGGPIRILIDGGNPSDTGTVRDFLEDRGIFFIDHVVSSHLDSDHAGGLIGLIEDRTLKFGRAWMHIPRNHLDRNEERVLRELVRTSKYGYRDEVKLITASLAQSRTLLDVIYEREIPVDEPFAGKKIGFLTVCGPSESYYETLLRDFRNIDQYIEQLDEQEVKIAKAKMARRREELLENPKTTVENNSSCILGTSYDGRKYLFTADAGAEALDLARNDYHMGNVHWMQIPHHGSLNNITQELIAHFSPKVAYVSAAGNQHHPSRAVVKGFKDVGAGVYSTHFPSERPLWHHYGDVPPRRTYGRATPL